MTSRTTADLVVKARWILPVEPAGRVFENHAVVVTGGRIVAITPCAALSEYPAREVMDRPDHVLIPGLVNAHTHAAMTLFRGIGGGHNVDDWLRQLIWPLESRLVDADFIADGTELAIAEMLLGGVTCFADMYFHPDVTAQVAARSGIRACIGLPVLEQPTGWAQGLDEYLERSLELRDRYRSDPLIDTCFAVHSPSLTQDSTLSRLRTLADQLQSLVMIHLLESPSERARETRRHGRGPLERLESAGLVNDLLLAVHCVQADTAEIGRLSLAGASIVHCPASNLKLASGIAPVPEMIDAGLNVALGTDGAASNDSLDVLGEARLAALLAAGVTGRPNAITPAMALEMATLAGARALGIAETTGSLASGKWADIACLKLAGPRADPVLDVAASILNAAGRSAVTDVWVAGRPLVTDGRLSRIDVTALGERARRWGTRVLAARASLAGQ